MSNKETYQAKIEAQLQEWQTEIASLKMSAAKAGTEIRQEFNKQLAALSARQETVRQKFQVVRQASGETWEESKIRLESAMTMLHQDLNQLKE
jgi:hypothetical protein